MGHPTSTPPHWRTALALHTDLGTARADEIAAVLTELGDHTPG
jgi:hypothetical protein